MLLNYLILIVLPISVISQLIDVAPKCIPELTEADKCFAPILFLGDKNIKQVKDEAALKAHCTVLDTSTKCMQKWGKCLPFLQGILFDYGFVGVKKLIANRCVDKKGQTEFLTANKCVNPATIKSTNACLAKLNGLFDKFVRDDKGNLIYDIQSLCCYTSYALDCVKQAAKKDCGGQAKLGEYLEAQAKDLIGPIGRAACGSMIGSYAECKTSAPHIVKFIDATVGSAVPSVKDGILVTLVQSFYRMAAKYMKILPPKKP